MSGTRWRVHARHYCCYHPEGVLILGTTSVLSTPLSPLPGPELGQRCPPADRVLPGSSPRAFGGHVLRSRLHELPCVVCCSPVYLVITAWPINNGSLPEGPLISLNPLSHQLSDAFLVKSPKSGRHRNGCPTYNLPQKALGPPLFHFSNYVSTPGPCGERPHPRTLGPRPPRAFCRKHVPRRDLGMESASPANSAVSSCVT